MSLSDFEQEVKEMAAEVDLEILQELGQTVVYTFSDGTTATLYANPEQSGPAKMRPTLNTRSREMTASWTIPFQDGLPEGSTPMMDETITDSDGNVFVVREWTADPLDSVFIFTDCICTTTKQVGAVGQ